MCCLCTQMVCYCVTLQFQQKWIALSSLFMISCSHWTDFFVFKFQEYNSDGRLLPSLQNQMVRKGLNYSDNFSLLDFSEFTSYRVNHTLALLKSKIPIDLSQPVTLSLSHEEMLRKEVKNTHKYINSEIFMEKWFFEKCQNRFSFYLWHRLLQRLERKPNDYS